MKILETERLILRHVLPEDAEFILDILNQPSFIQYIGDRGVRDRQARAIISRAVLQKAIAITALACIWLN